MLRKITPILAVAILLLSACSQMQVQTDLNPQYDFSRLRTFKVIYNPDRGIKSINKERIATAIANELTKKGYTPVADRDKADFIVIFHTNVTNKSQVVTDYQRVGLYPYTYHYSPMVPVQREYNYTEGKLVVDAVDPVDKAIFWRGVVTDVLQNLSTPEERTEYINKAVNKVMESFPPRS